MDTYRIPAALLLLTLLACGGDTPQEEGKRGGGQPPLVEAVPARIGALPLSERVSGSVKARNQVEIRAEVDAPVLEVYVRGGERVAKGQPLVRHRDTELREQLRRAEADVQVAQAAARQESARVAELDAQVRRTRTLAEDQLVSPLELERLEAQLNAARAGVEQASASIAQARAIAAERRSALSRAIVRAPVAGTIGLRNVEVGSLPGRDALLFVIGDLSQVIVEIPLTQEMLSEIRPGAPVLVTAAGITEPRRGTITRISPFLTATSRSTIAEIELANPDGRLRPGMSARVDVVYGESGRATLVPLSALHEDVETGKVSVFVAGSMTANVDEQQPRPVTQRAVEVLARGAGTAGVRGVNEGEWVVSIGQHLLARENATTARVRPAKWEQVLQLQGLQREDLLAQFLEKQQQIGRTRGSVPPTSAEYLAATPAPAGRK